jgi:hypothetical protein
MKLHGNARSCPKSRRRTQVFGIPLIDALSKSARYARSALPDAPVIEDEKKRPVFAVVMRADRR